MTDKDAQQAEQDPTEKFEVVTNEGAAPAEPETDESAVEEKPEPETDNESDSETPNTEQKPKSNRFQNRIDRLSKRANEAERIAAEERQKREDLERKLSGGNADSNDEELDPANFDSYSDYLDALAKFNDEQNDTKPKDKPASDQKEPVDAEFNDALEEVQAAFADSSSKYADFNEVVTAEDVRITPDMVKAMAETEDPAAVAYFLGKNKTEAARIAGLKPLAIAREFGRIEAKLSQAPRKTVTQAPDPISPLSGSDGTEPSLDSMSFAEYEAAMNKKDTRRGFW